MFLSGRLGWGTSNDFVEPTIDPSLHIRAITVPLVPSVVTARTMRQGNVLLPWYDSPLGPLPSMAREAKFRKVPSDHLRPGVVGPPLSGGAKITLGLTPGLVLVVPTKTWFSARMFP